MKHALPVLFASGALFSYAQQQLKPNSEPARKPGSCLAVRPAGSHALRNVMLLGVAGALIAHQQYRVVDAVNYPAKVGQKFHGDDLQTISTSGTKVAILDKHYATEDLHKACQ